MFILFGWECFESVLSFFISFVTDLASVQNTNIVNRLVVTILMVWLKRNCMEKGENNNWYVPYMY